MWGDLLELSKTSRPSMWPYLAGDAMLGCFSARVPRPIVAPDSVNPRETKKPASAKRASRFDQEKEGGWICEEDSVRPALPKP